MNRRQFLHTSAGAVAAGNAPIFCETGSNAATTPNEEDALSGPARGPWRRLFLDAMVVEESTGLTRTFHAAEKHSANPVIRRDQPWEGVAGISGPYLYGTVMQEAGKLRMWYQCLNKGNHVGYAESMDGIAWTKPRLGLIEIGGSKDNNVVISAAQRAVTGGESHNPSVIRGADGTYTLFTYDVSCGHVRSAHSIDGLRWTFTPETRERGLFSSSDVVNFFWDPYLTQYAATWKARNRRGRAVGVVWSEDGRSWTKPVDGPVFVADDLDPDATQIYGMPVFAYQGLYIGMPWLYNARYLKDKEYSVARLHEAQSNSPRTVDTQLAWSWDLVNWTRPTPRYAFIPRGGKDAFDAGMIFTARAVLVGDRLFFYYGGCDGMHDEPRVTANIGIATLRLDGFCAMTAGTREGWLITRRESLRAPRIFVNARTAGNGWLVAELLNRRNQVIASCSRHDCVPFTGDSIRHEFAWMKTPTISTLNDVKVRFYLRNAELYSYWPASDNTGP